MRATCADFLKCSFVFLSLVSWGQAREPLISGLRFSVGNIPGHVSAAEVEVSEVVIGAQKRGFLKIGALPVLVAKGVKVTFSRPEGLALREMMETLKQICKAERVDVANLSLWIPDEKAPRLVVGEVVLKTPEEWTLKRVIISGKRTMESCDLVFRPGPDSTVVASKDGRVAFDELLKASR